MFHFQLWGEGPGSNTVLQDLVGFSHQGRKKKAYRNQVRTFKVKSFH